MTVFADGFSGPSFDAFWTPVATNGSFPHVAWDFGTGYGVDGRLFTVFTSVGEDIALNHYAAETATYRAVSALFIPFTPNVALVTYNRRALITVASSTVPLPFAGSGPSDWLVAGALGLSDDAAGALFMVFNLVAGYGSPISFPIFDTTTTFAWDASKPYWQYVLNNGWAYVNKSADGITWTNVYSSHFGASLPTFTATSAYFAAAVEIQANPFIYAGSGRTEVDNFIYVSAGGGRPAYTPAISGVQGASSSNYVRRKVA